nr:MAG TPA: hypothetical protein [Caudoviricetes sp.]
MHIPHTVLIFCFTLFMNTCYCMFIQYLVVEVVWTES